jgi:hypothetical protein
MKKSISFIIIISLTIISFNSCKKGDNDPLLSVLTRTQRLSGNWKVIKEETKIEYNVTGLQDTSIVTNVIFDGTMAIATTVYKNSDTSVTVKDTSYYNEEIKFDKSGSYSKSTKNNISLALTTIEGNWIFLNKSDAYDLNNKEAILLTTTSQLETDGTNTTILNYEDLDGETLVIDRLTNKELIITNNKTFKNDNSLQSGSMTVKTTYESK